MKKIARYHKTLEKKIESLSRQNQILIFSLVFITTFLIGILMGGIVKANSAYRLMVLRQRLQDEHRNRLSSIVQKYGSKVSNQIDRIPQ